MQKFILYTLFYFLMNACKEPQFIIPTDAEFGNKMKVEIIGYDKDVMEVFLSRDGKLLFFNNSNAAGENTNLHYAKFLNDSTFQYLGELKISIRMTWKPWLRWIHLIIFTSRPIGVMALRFPHFMRACYKMIN